MRFDRESWRKLYVAESMQHRKLSIVTRGIRDYLLRVAEEDGTLFAETADPAGDLAGALNAHEDRKIVDKSVKELLKIGYLSHQSGRLWITKFEEAQAARSPGAKRQAKYAAKKKSDNGDVNAPSPDDVSTSSLGDVTNDVIEAVTSDVTKDETRRDETTTTGAAAVVDLQIPCPSDLILTDAQIGTLLGDLVPADAVPWLTRRFVANYQADPSDKRTLVVWRKCLSKAVSSGWNDGRTKQEYLRNRADSKSTDTDDTGGYGSSKDWA